jgi:hypothetical protein
MEEGKNNTTGGDSDIKEIIPDSSSEKVWIKDCENTGKDMEDDDEERMSEDFQGRKSDEDIEALKKKWHNRKSVLEIEAVSLRQRIEKKNEKLRKRIIVLVVFVLIVGVAVGLIVGLS